MPNILTFNRNYFGLTILLFIIEVLIALFVHDNFIRPYIGDVLVVILMYCFIKSFLKLRPIEVSIFVLVFSFSIEFIQYLNLIEKMNLSDSKIARTVLGTSFSWIDLLCYIIGIVVILITEKIGSEKAIL